MNQNSTNNMANGFILPIKAVQNCRHYLFKTFGGINARRTLTYVNTTSVSFDAAYCTLLSGPWYGDDGATLVNSGTGHTTAYESKLWFIPIRIYAII